MKIEINQKLNEEYYKEYYSEWLSFKSKFKKWEHIIGYISIGASIILYSVDNSLKFISIGLLIFGLLMVYEFYSSRTKWLKDRLQSKMNNKDVTLIFEENKIRSIGPFTEMDGKWDFFKDVIETKKGLILIPENGINIYLQKKSFQNQSDIKSIILKVKEARQNIAQ